jgi:hypothetical protein
MGRRGPRHGFDGWWDNELYSPLHWEWPDPFAVGTGLRAVLGGLLEDPPTGSRY